MMLPMARDLGKHGIRAVAISPGYIWTPLAEPLLKDEEFRNSILKDIPLGRLGDIEDFSLMIKSLIENSYLNGVVLRVDGGLKLSHI
mmetsp:Transcript_28608/g.27600  ORF Transcript_28608/g.27600 Transcript_28608/m.27600 type:complete len:87 (-) Transcript_28608:37-297(-)